MTVSLLVVPCGPGAGRLERRGRRRRAVQGTWRVPLPGGRGWRARWCGPAGPRGVASGVGLPVPGGDGDGPADLVGAPSAAASFGIVGGDRSPRNAPHSIGGVGRGWHDCVVEGPVSPLWRQALRIDPWEPARAQQPRCGVKAVSRGTGKSSAAPGGRRRWCGARRSAGQPSAPGWAGQGAFRAGPEVHFRPSEPHRFHVKLPPSGETAPRVEVLMTTSSGRSDELLAVEGARLTVSRCANTGSRWRRFGRVRCSRAERAARAVVAAQRGTPGGAALRPWIQRSGRFRAARRGHPGVTRPVGARPGPGRYRQSDGARPWPLRWRGTVPPPPPHAQGRGHTPRSHGTSSTSREEVPTGHGGPSPIRRSG
jgi:hypothetical protein